MFNRTFFTGPDFLEHVRRYAGENGYQTVRVRVATVGGAEIDVQTWRVNNVGLRIYTRTGDMIFVPFDRIVDVHVSAPAHGGDIGFQIPTDDEAENSAE